MSFPGLYVLVLQSWLSFRKERSFWEAVFQRDCFVSLLSNNFSLSSHYVYEPKILIHFSVRWKTGLWIAGEIYLFFCYIIFLLSWCSTSWRTINIKDRKQWSGNNLDASLAHLFKWWSRSDFLLGHRKVRFCKQIFCAWELLIWCENETVKLRYSLACKFFDVNYRMLIFGMQIAAVVQMCRKLIKKLRVNKQNGENLLDQRNSSLNGLLAF